MKDTGLKPFFCYFGGKWRIAPYYPAPTFRKIIEPLAGAAGYALRYYRLDVELYEADATIFGIWDYLIKAKPSEILALPLEVRHVDEMDAPQEAKSLVGFWLNKGGTTPKKTPSAWARSGVRPKSYWGAEIRGRIAYQVNHIRHWRVKNESYEKAPNESATWFIDPPYFGACGRLYRHRIDDYASLAEWSKTRKGQVIVCEREGATWLPFICFRAAKATPGSRGKSISHEVVWRNDMTSLHFN